MTNETFRVINKTRVSLVRGDITRQQVDVIVNAANSGLLGGGGVDGAIHRAGGPAILEECKEIRKIQGTCAPGDAVITSGGRLSAKHVIHGVGPIWRGGTTNEAATLASAYRTCLSIAADHALKTIAFPSISTGAYGYPVGLAAEVALSTVREFCESDDALSEIRFVLFDEIAFCAYEQALQKTADS